MKFKCYLMNTFINNKNFAVYESKDLIFINLETAVTTRTVAKLSKKQYSDLMNELQEKFDCYAFDNVECFDYLCDKFN